MNLANYDSQNPYIDGRTHKSGFEIQIGYIDINHEKPGIIWPSDCD